MSESEHSRVTRSFGVTGTSGSTGTQTASRTRSNASRRTTTLAVEGARLGQRAGAMLGASWRWLRGTITPAGWLLTGLAVVALPAGLTLGWVELVVAGIIALFLLALSVPFLFSARSYDVELSLDTTRVVAGTEVTGTLGVTSTAPGITLPGRVDLPIGEGLLDVHVPLLRSGHTYTETIVVPAAHRGIVTIGPARAVRSDPLGILKREASWSETHTLWVHPATVALPPSSSGFLRDLEGNPSNHIVPADISFHAIREYVPGDARRHVHWKSTAKTGRLMVRQYEETRRSRMVIVLALSDDEFGTDDEFELAVSAAASLGVRGIRDGRDVSVITGGEVPEFGRLHIRSVRELATVTTRALLDELAGIDRLPRVTRLKDAAQLAAESHADASLAVLVCGGAVHARELSQAALAFGPGVGVAAVVCNPESEPGLRRLGTTSVITIGLPGDLRQLLSRGAIS